MEESNGVFVPIVCYNKYSSIIIEALIFKFISPVRRATQGFEQAECDGNLQSRNGVGFWCDYSKMTGTSLHGDGSVIMIGGGGKNCSRADHGIGITDANQASFDKSSDEFDFGFSAYDNPTNSYSLNLWVN